jgi:hypothetical protein
MAFQANFKQPGLINGIASGLNQGIQQFNQAFHDARQDELANKRYKAELLSKGLLEDPDTGEFKRTPEAEAAAKLGLIKTQDELADYDRTSDAANSLRALNMGLAKQAGLDVDLNNMSPNQMKNYVNPQLDVAAKIMGARATKDAARIEKNSKQHTDALINTTTLLESARGNPAAAQAERDIYAAGKIKSLAYLHGDPNLNSPQENQLLASEVAKLASGGVPSIHELQGLNPSTLPSGLAALAQKVVNHPEPANAGAFIKAFTDYAEQLEKDAQEVISDKYGRVIEARKGILGDDNYNALQKQYVKRFENARAKSEAGKTDKQPAFEMTPDVINYAKTHNITPEEALKVKKSRTQPKGLF